MSPAFDETFDLVIVGSGGGPMAAALAQKSLGRSPIILEKTDKIGGSTAMSGGVLWIPNHPLQVHDGVQDSPEMARAYLDAVVGDQGPATSRARKDAYLRTGPAMIEFLQAQGIGFIRAEGWSDYYDDRPGGCARGRSLGCPIFDTGELKGWQDKIRGGPLAAAPLTVAEIRSITWVTRSFVGMRTAGRMALRIIKGKILKRAILGTGGALQGRMLKAVLTKNIPVRLDTAVKELIEVNGRVVGVVAVKDGREIRIQGRLGTLINAGGFSHNTAMREQFGPKPSGTDMTNANPGDTGEMIQDAHRLGAALDLTDQAWWVPGSHPPDGQVFMHVMDIAKPHCILVNDHAERFTDEAGSYMENGQAMYANGVYVWAILDARHRKRYVWGAQAPGQTPAEWITSGYMKKADTLEKLGRQCNLDPCRLAETIALFNEGAVKGEDAAFKRGQRAYDRCAGDPTNKPNPSLGAIEVAPFYAVRLFPGDVGTAGGLLTDEYARVLRPDGAPIQGLYATGNSTASVMGKAYPGAGASIGASFVFGYIAARHAAGVTRTDFGRPSAEQVNKNTR